MKPEFRTQGQQTASHAVHLLNGSNVAKTASHAVHLLNGSNVASTAVKCRRNSLRKNGTRSIRWC